LKERKEAKRGDASLWTVGVALMHNVCSFSSGTILEKYLIKRERSDN